MIRSTVVSLVALVVVFLVGATYLTIDVARINPFRSDYTISAILKSSGGLLDTSPVMLEGVPAGKVTSIRVTDNQLAVDMSIDSGYKIPRGSVMTIQNLSVAGEQYINFIPPDTTTSEYLRSGDLVPASAIHVSQSVPPRCSRKCRQWPTRSIQHRFRPSTKRSRLQSTAGKRTSTRSET